MRFSFTVLRRLVVFLIAAVALAVGPAHAAAIVTPRVEAELHSARTAVAPGETFTLLLRQKMTPDWHVYWLNPGDSGAPTILEWETPEGVEIAPMRFPAPVPYALGPLVNYVHYGEIIYPMDVTAPADWPAGRPLDLRARAVWLVCEEICIPEEGELSISIPTASAGADDPVWAARARAAVAALPIKAFDARIEASTDDGLTLAVTPAANGALAAAIKGGLRAARFFPYSQTLLEHGGDQRIAIENGVIEIAAPLSGAFETAPAFFTGVLTGEAKGADGTWRAVAFALGPQPPPPSASAIAPAAAPSKPQSGFAQMLLFAVLGGLILNVMPCVLPILSLKALALAQAEPRTARTHGLWFLVGVLTSFLALAGVVIVAQAAGAAIGWGFQLQEPFVIAALALLFFLIGLNLIGAFDVGFGFQNLGGELAQRGGAAGAFFTGALAVVAATPCTAPFMAGALGWAAMQPAPQALAVFAGLGLGFAAPFTLLSIAPGARRFLPKPGPWTAQLRQALAFPMFATAVWLVWVLSGQAGRGGAGAALALMVAASFLIWAWRQGSRLWRAAGLAALALAALIAWTPLADGRRTEGDAVAVDAWSPERVAALRAENRPVFVNFTADWCMTCKYNEFAVLSRPAIEDAFAAQGVTVLKADWTRRDPAITAALADLGQSGIPVYLYYAPGASAPEMLPLPLTKDAVLRALDAEP